MNHEKIFHIMPKPFRFLLPDEFGVRAKYLRHHNAKINLDNPVTINEKINWLKLHDRSPLHTQCTDKYAVRKYVAEKYGAHILNELYGVYDNVRQIDFDALPNSFTLKVNRGSGQNILVRDKSKLDVAQAKIQLKKWMKHKYHTLFYEWAYKDIVPKIVCERYMENSDGEIADYKFDCFHGKPHFVQVDLDRHTGHTQAFYTTDWERCEFTSIFPAPKKAIEPPSCLNEMLEIAASLSSGFIYVRVDLYEWRGAPVFGEMTFYPLAGYHRQFTPDCWNRYFGGLIRLPIGGGARG